MGNTPPARGRQARREGLALLFLVGDGRGTQAHQEVGRLVEEETRRRSGIGRKSNNPNLRGWGILNKK